MRLLCLGFGFTAQAFVARQLVCQLAPVGDGRGWLVGTGRDGTRLGAALEPFGGAACVFDGGVASDALVAAARAASHVLVSIPPREGDGCLAFGALGDVLAASDTLEWLGYLSATSVYGDRNGGWCVESDPLTPISARGRARVLAEEQWLGGVAQAHVFRLPGIYGPGRSAFDGVRAGTARRWDTPDHVFNRAHVDDIGEALALSVGAPTPSEVFNVADDAPAPQSDVIGFAAEMLGVEVAPLEAFSLEKLPPKARAFWAERKRVSNAKLKEVLGWRPTYPSYREGLAAVLAAEDGRIIGG